MKLSHIFLALLPFVYADRIHKLKLKKVESVNDAAAFDPEIESAYLAQKYGALNQLQLPLIGAGGSGRRTRRPTVKDGEQLLWTQEQLKGGHGVPLSSMSISLA